MDVTYTQGREDKPLSTLWRTLVPSGREYCCRLCPHLRPRMLLPCRPPENIYQQDPGSTILSYWDRLRHLWTNSLQRRRERFTVIYVWKILENLVPNMSLLEHSQPGRGRLWCVRATQGHTQRRGTLTHNSLHSGARLLD